MNTKKLLTSLLSIAFLAGPLAGCLGGDDAPVEAPSEDQLKADEILGEQGRDKLVDVASVIPKNWSMDGQRLLPPTELNFVGKVDTSAVGSYEAERDEGGLDYNTVLHTYDISPQLPAGQPAEIVIDLFWDASEFNSADLDIFVDVPGTKTSYSQVSETMNWNHVLKTMVVNTVGVQGQSAVVGVQIASGIVSQGFEYKLDIRFQYVEDVLTPYHAWGLEVPSGAGGIILESVKAGGDEHIRSEFVLLDPDQNLVKYVMFDDINIPTQSVLIPVSKPGRYVFYAYYMEGGFLSAKADVPLDNTVATPLGVKEEEIVLTSDLAPGVAGKDFLHPTANAPVEDMGAVAFDVPLNDKFPLRVTGFIRGQVVADSKITLSSPKGLVHELIVIAKYEDDKGTIGYTSDHEGRWTPSAEGGAQHEGGYNNVFRYMNVDKGAWTASVVNDGPAGVEIGYRVLTVG